MLSILRHSFSTRLSFFILLFTTTIFVATFAIFYHFSKRIIEKNEHNESENALKIINLQIEKVLRHVEAVPNNLNWVIASEKILPDAMFSITQNVVRNNPDIYGSAIAFEPYYFKEKGYYFSPYSYRDGDTIHSLQLGNEDYDYFNWEWYSKPKDLGAPCWSNPYYDEGGGQMIMCSYSAPILDRKGAMIGIFTADISLEWLTDMIDEMNSCVRSYTFMLDKNGTYIIHDLRERILNQTIFEVSEEIAEPVVKLIGEDMIAGKQGVQVFNNNGIKSFVFYAPIPRTQWSVGIVLPRDEVFRDLHRINLLLIIVGGFGLIALFLICSKIVKNLTQPLKKFADSARKIALGEFSIELPNIRSKDEMKELHDSFSYMQSELINYIEDLQQTSSDKEKIESELRIARNIQMSMIPKVFSPFPSCSDIDLYAVLNPAKEVGGDLYDFFMDNNKLYFAIGDVSGKGVPASLFMAVTRTLFHAIAANANPDAVMNAINLTLSKNNESNMFVTLLIGVLNINTGIMQYCNAGHNPPVVIAPDGNCSWLELTPNLPVGVARNFLYQMQSITLLAGTALVLYTDGITEAENSKKELYSERRLMETINFNATLSSQELTEAILSNINNHIKENDHSDDIAILVIGYRKNQNKTKSTLVISNNIGDLKKITQFIENIGLSGNIAMNINLAIEEAVVNVIRHGYNGSQITEDIEISFMCEEDNLIFTITDTGSTFDLTLVDAPDITLSAEERSVGGLGILLIKKIMDKVVYRRENGKNILTLVKKK